MEHHFRTAGYSSMLKTQAADLIQAYCEKNIKRYNQFKNKLKSVGVQPVRPASFTSEKDRVFDKELLQDLEEVELSSSLNDDINSKYFDIGPTSDFDGDSLFNGSDKYDVLFESLSKPIYDNCKDFFVLNNGKVNESKGMIMEREAMKKGYFDEEKRKTFKSLTEKLEAFTLQLKAFTQTVGVSRPLHRSSGPLFYMNNVQTQGLYQESQGLYQESQGLEI
ncbi:hypothetical protein AgCh_028790 [Apium graveolens]